MDTWADGGMTMRKPYISGDGYIMKMGNYSKSTGARSGSKRTKKQIDTQETSKQELAEQETKTVDTARRWNEEWNAVFHHFIDRNATKLLRTYYAGLVRAWQKKPQLPIK